MSGNPLVQAAADALRNATVYPDDETRRNRTKCVARAYELIDAKLVDVFGIEARPHITPTYITAEDRRPAWLACQFGDIRVKFVPQYYVDMPMAMRDVDFFAQAPGQPGWSSIDDMAELVHFLHTSGIIAQ